MRKAKDYILLYFKGLGMGVVDVVPGISGGTVAFITGIHHTLLYSLRSIDAEALLLLRRLQFRAFWKKINGAFLTVLFAGILTSVFSLIKVMTHLLRHHPILIWSFFFGLILIAAPLELREIRKWSISTVIWFVLGIAIVYGLSTLSPAQTPIAFWLVFIAGFVASCGMVLPGISGAFILLLIGKYQFIITAFSSVYTPAIVLFVSGYALGLLVFSRFLSQMIENYHSATVALLAGFILGSLNKVWPWREVQEYVTNSKGEQVPVFDKSILPWHYFDTTGKDPQVFQAILMMALGVFIVVLIEKIAARLNTKI